MPRGAELLIAASVSLTGVRHDQHGRVSSANDGIRNAAEHPATQACTPLCAHRYEAVTLFLSALYYPACRSTFESS